MQSKEPCGCRPAHRAIDLETGKTRMIEAATANAIGMIMLPKAIEAMYSGKRLLFFILCQDFISCDPANLRLYQHAQDRSYCDSTS